MKTWCSQSSGGKRKQPQPQRLRGLSPINLPPSPPPAVPPIYSAAPAAPTPGFQRAVAPPQGVAESMASSCRNIATLLVVPAEPPTATHLPPLPSQDVQAERANCREQGAPPSQEHFTSSTPTAHQLTLPTDQTDPPTGATLKHTRTAHGNAHRHRLGTEVYTTSHHHSPSGSRTSSTYSLMEAPSSRGPQQAPTGHLERMVGKFSEGLLEAFVSTFPSPSKPLL